LADDVATESSKTAKGIKLVIYIITTHKHILFSHKTVNSELLQQLLHHLVNIIL